MRPERAMLTCLSRHHQTDTAGKRFVGQLRHRLGTLLEGILPVRRRRRARTISVPGFQPTQDLEASGALVAADPYVSSGQGGAKPPSHTA